MSQQTLTPGGETDNTGARQAGRPQPAPATHTPAGAECVNPYDGDTAPKAGQVRRMFDSIAPAYDLMNNAMTAGMHRLWRRRALDALQLCVSARAPRLLDIATGTGDVAFDLARRFPAADVTGIDLSEGMLGIARRKLARSRDAARISFMQADCLSLPFADNSFDAITVAYGVRNFQRLADGYSEMLRTLKPGGTLCVIELSCPEKGLTRKLYDIYAGKVIPALGQIVSGDRGAYAYLPRSIAAAPQREAMTDMMRQAGFTRAAWRSLTFGAVTVYLARKPL